MKAQSLQIVHVYFSNSTYTAHVPSRPDSSECHGPRATASSTRHLCPIFLRTDPKLCRACDATALQERRQERREAVASVRLQRVPILTALLERSFTLHHHHTGVFPFFVLVPPAGLASSSFPLPWEAHSHSDLSASSRTCLAARAHRRTAPLEGNRERHLHSIVAI